MKVISSFFSTILRKKINIFLQLVYFLFFIISVVVCAVYGERTLDARLYNFAMKINNSYENPISDSSKYPYIRLEQENKKYYQDLFDYYYYTNSSTDVGEVRQICSLNEIGFYSNSGNYFPTSISKQNVFSIYGKGNVGYMLEYNLFEVYYKDELLPNRGYLNRRFNCNGFCFISDSLADKLLSEYGLSSYGQLILDEKYGVLKMVYGDETNTFCINNIIYSSQKNGPRLKQLYGDFCLTYGDNISMNLLPYCCEFDLKSDIYTTSKFLKEINQFGYNTKNTDFSFFQLSENNYIVNEQLSIELDKIDFSQRDSNFYLVVTILSCVYVIGSFVLLYFGLYKLNALIIVAFVIMCITNSFIYLPPVSTMALVIFGSTSIVCFLFGLCLEVLNDKKVTV